VRGLVVGASDPGDAAVGGHDDDRGHVVFLKLSIRSKLQTIGK